MQTEKQKQAFQDFCDDIHNAIQQHCFNLANGVNDPIDFVSIIDLHINDIDLGQMVWLLEQAPYDVLSDNIAASLKEYLCEELRMPTYPTPTDCTIPGLVARHAWHLRSDKGKLTLVKTRANVKQMPSLCPNPNTETGGLG